MIQKHFMSSNSLKCFIIIYTIKLLKQNGHIFYTGYVRKSNTFSTQKILVLPLLLLIIRNLKLDPSEEQNFSYI